MILKQGVRGEEVKKLQQILRQFQSGLQADGVFGPRTERAVRIAQRRLGLYPPDGIVGPLTWGALNGQSPWPSRRSDTPSPSASPVGRGDPGRLRPIVDPARKRAERSPETDALKRSAANMRMSLKGRQFIVRHEGQPGVSQRLHHPTAASGVTIGPGYDMKDRTQASIAADLEAIGVAPNIAAKAAQGAGKQAAAATNFVNANKNLLSLTDAQQAQLLQRVIAQYERPVRRDVRIELTQYQFDALVSYAYNTGGGWSKVIKLVNEERYHDAMMQLSKYVYSGKQRVDSLVRRRAAETKLFLYGEYR